MMQTTDQRRLMNVGEKLTDIHIALSKTYVLINNLMSNYFAYSKKGHEDDDGKRLLHGYEEAQVFVGLANDCIYAALQCADKVLEEMDQEGEAAEQQ